MRLLPAAMLLAVSLLATGCSDSGEDGGEGDKAVTLPDDLCSAVSDAAPDDWELSIDDEKKDGTECTLTAGSGEDTVLTVTWTEVKGQAEEALAQSCDFLFQAESDGDRCVVEQPELGGAASPRAARAFLAGESEGVVAVSAYSEDRERAGDLEGVLDDIEDELAG